VNPARISAVALLTTATLGLAAPLAWARVDPDPMSAGQRVSISDGKRCGGGTTGAAARSVLFGTVALRPDGDAMTARAKVAAGATPGRYRVTVECGPGGRQFTERVTVRGGRNGGVSANQAAGGLALLVLAGGAAYLLRRSVNGRSW
jgi:hypothetical protein